MSILAPVPAVARAEADATETDRIEFVVAERSFVSDDEVLDFEPEVRPQARQQAVAKEIAKPKTSRLTAEAFAQPGRSTDLRRLPKSWTGGVAPLWAASVNYVDACRIGREMFERAAAANLSGRESRVLENIIARTVCFSKLADATFVEQIADEVGLDRTRRARNRPRRKTASGKLQPGCENTKKILRKLEGLGLIERYPARSKHEFYVIALPGWQDVPLLDL